MSIESQQPIVDRKQEARLRATSLIGYYEQQIARNERLMQSFGQKEVAGGHSEHSHTRYCEMEIEDFKNRIEQLGGIFNPNTKSPENMVYPLSHSESGYRHPESIQMMSSLTQLAKLHENNFRYKTKEEREQMWKEHMDPVNPDFRHGIIIDRGNDLRPIFLQAKGNELHSELRTVAIENCGNVMCWTASGYTGREVMVIDSYNTLAPWWTEKTSSSKSAIIDIETYVVSDGEIVDICQKRFSLLTGSKCRVLEKDL